MFAGEDALQGPASGERTHVHYEIENAKVEGFWLPARVRLQVNDNVDVRFTLEDCLVKKADAVLKVAPPN